MASRLARSAVGAARARPTVSVRTLPAFTTAFQPARYQSNVPADPKKEAQSIIDSLPGQNLASKVAILSAGAGASVWAISNELYVVNEETIVAFSLLTMFWGVFKYGGPLYKDWAEGQVTKLRDILNSSRQHHTEAVKARIESVKDLGSVTDTTKALFEVSKETASLEAKAYELQQKTEVVAEIKSVLDSWVRYEGQVKQRQQKELAQSIIAKIEKELENPKVLKQILDQSVAEVERLVSQKAS